MYEYSMPDFEIYSLYLYLILNYTFCIPTSHLFTASQHTLRKHFLKFNLNAWMGMINWSLHLIHSPKNLSGYYTAMVWRHQSYSSPCNHFYHSRGSHHLDNYLVSEFYFREHGREDICWLCEVHGWKELRQNHASNAVETNKPATHDYE